MPITSTGVHQHLIYIKPYSSFLVPVPVVPTTRGKIKIIIIGRCQAAKVGIPLVFSMINVFVL